MPTFEDTQKATGSEPKPRDTGERTKIRVTLDIEQWALSPGELHDEVIDAINSVAYVSNQIAYVELKEGVSNDSHRTL